MDLVKILQEISNNWVKYREFCETESKSGAKIKVMRRDHEVHDLVENQWKREIEKKVNSKKYLVDSSVGKGNLRPGPWLTIMDKSITETATERYYLAYLFSRSAKKLYLSVAIAGTQFQDLYGMKKEAVEKIDIFTRNWSNLFKHLDPGNQNVNIDLLEDDLDFEEPISGSSRNLTLLFEKGSFFTKEYDLLNLTDKELNEDLSKYINIYDEIVNDPKSENFDIGAESVLDKKEQVKKDELDFDYTIPDFQPKEKIKKKREESTSTKAKYKRASQDSKATGKAGEDYVFEFEVKKLKKVNKPELASKVYNHDENREYPGWDITSYNEKGEKIFIEVKSSKKSKTVFNISANEWEAAKREGNKYFIYIVENALTDKIKIVARIQNPLKYLEDEKIEVNVSQYEIRL